MGLLKISITNTFDESSVMAQNVVGGVTIVAVVVVGVMLWHRWRLAKAAKSSSKDMWELHM
ncbi:hypothetical protein H257_11806 [Aphanomyces astaci]|uniref:Uncharacterized protein n=1 Tax=Aphanomyces astaci TaxID=112090 RepID=W4G0P4_APHAT|nr:hypothetical protein H257_11806 [Aphanomyces astaci]ETV73265.1 hypothetical protein H257_11806 [Aphanomyces astaci]|eukprot:XP_009837140.1 hypothetical protein H257_11806 [Aphanomyces astaci]